MNPSVIWALVALVAVVAAWDMVRRWAFATATRALKAQLDAMHAEFADLSGRLEDRGFEKLPARVKQLETVVIALKQHVEAQVARPNPFVARKAGG